MGEPEAVSPDKPAPKTTLQYLILYPTLILSLLGAIPTAMKELKAWQQGVASSKLPFLEEQQALWTRNLGCAGTGSTWEFDTAFDHTTVAITFCRKTGDILIRYLVQGEPDEYRWMQRQ